MREPVRQRLSIILYDLGIGVAGRGEDLNDVIRRADPALKEVDKVLKILARQNEVLAAAGGRLGHDPRRRWRASAGTSAARSSNSGEVAQATAERRVALAADIERLPTFLTELTPTMARLGALSDEMTPVLTRPRRGRAGHQPDGPGARAVLARPRIPALESLGEAAKTAARRR